MMAYAVTICFVAFDWLMSLDPHGLSSICGVCFFSGTIVGVLAFATLVLLAPARNGALEGATDSEHYHDLGKLLFGYVLFWAYIAFSRYLLIFTGPYPEMTLRPPAARRRRWRRHPSGPDGRRFGI